MSYTIRPCRTLQELSACVKLQKDIWGYSDPEVYPLRLFVTISRIGGQVLGAFTPEGQQVGFVASLPAWRSNMRYYHSLSLGVHPEHENRGLGRALKLEQRRHALSAGVRCIEWTFDPLKAKNAYFNLVRLGAIARRYLADHYGAVASRLQQGLPSDRLVAEWWLDSRRISRAIEGTAPAAAKKPAGIVEIPRDAGRLAASDPAQARRVQSRVRDELTALFDRRLVITGFQLGEQSGRYVLETAGARGVPGLERPAGRGRRKR